MQKLRIITPFWPRLQNSQLLKQLEKGVPIQFAVLPDGGCVKKDETKHATDDPFKELIMIIQT